MQWFYDMVKNMAPWDYKQQGSQYADFGNFNYGLTGAAAGIPSDVLLRAAGYAQQRAGTSRPEWGDPTGSPPYGDDPRDQCFIKKGIDYYDKYYDPCNPAMNPLEKILRNFASPPAWRWRLW